MTSSFRTFIEPECMLSGLIDLGDCLGWPRLLPDAIPIEALVVALFVAAFTVETVTELKRLALANAKDTLFFDKLSGDSIRLLLKLTP